VEPTSPIDCPAITGSPTFTYGAVCMWQYLLVVPPGCPMSTYQPQPFVYSGLPSRSQPHSPPVRLSMALHRTRCTVPEAAATMVVCRAAPRSTPVVAGPFAGTEPGYDQRTHGLRPALGGDLGARVDSHGGQAQRRTDVACRFQRILSNRERQATPFWGV
jgi:hypothetical protein